MLLIAAGVSETAHWRCTADCLNACNQR
jgi:hypothetical protein